MYEPWFIVRPRPDTTVSGRHLGGVHLQPDYCSGISASTGMPCLSTPWRLSTAIFTRYTSLERSSAVWTLRGVNSAFEEMKLMVPGMLPPASVNTVAG